MYAEDCLDLGLKPGKLALKSNEPQSNQSQHFDIRMLGKH